MPALNSPAELVDAFYDSHFVRDMGFSQESVARKRPWLAPDL
ncbi:MAG: hypothetical protein ACT4NU_04235 [Chromatiales bacterium]